MKRLVLLFAGLLIGLTTASATEQTNQKPDYHLDISKRYRYAQPIVFIERGVEFLIFPDGNFDYNTTSRNIYDDDDAYQNNSRPCSVNTTYRGPNLSVSFSSNRVDRGFRVFKDRYGKVTRVGNVFLNYDRYGNITRAGSVAIRYGRGKNATVNQVGGLRVHYNQWGEIVNSRGSVNANNRNLFYDDRRHNNRDGYHYNNDDNFYYYKQNGKVKKHKKNKR